MCSLKNVFSTFLPQKKALVASHYIWIIGAFLSYIGFIGNIGALAGLQF